MKKIFTNASKPFSLPALPPLPKSFPNLKLSNLTTGNKASSTAIPASTLNLPTQPSLQPKYVVPPVPHPCPHDHLAILVTSNGLLIRPHISGEQNQGSTSTYARIPWSKPVKVEEIPSSKIEANWEEAVIVYGIVGVLELYTAGYLLVISSKSVIGNVVDGSHTVYGVKGVTAIPLQEARARIVVNTLISRNAQLARPSIIPPKSTLQEAEDGENEALLGPRTPEDDASIPSAPRVQFANEHQVKLMTPVVEQFSEQEGASKSYSPQSSVSDLSIASSNGSMSEPASVAKTLTSRLSFWSRLSKRTPHSSSDPAEESLMSDPEIHPSMTAAEEQEVVEQILQGEAHDSEPGERVSRIVSATAPPPANSEEQNSELEEKVVRECIREYTKGGMYFAYNFDITRSLQHKQDQIAKMRKQQELLADLNALDPGTSTVEGTKIDPMSEPNPTLPLWRRVDRRFWWNEWLSKPFIDAGLHSYVLPIMQGYYQVAHIPIPPDPVTHDEAVLVDYVVVSRRSRYRAGLRYQRRGIDEDANVANFVETETIMRVERLGAENIFSFVQIRGSIPLFWTQSGYSLKPPPVLASDRTPTQHLEALKRHFNRTIPLYGPHTAVNLAEQNGKEGAITQAYRDYMMEFSNKDARYYEYDFHVETRGMKYEKIAELITAMEKIFDSQGYLWISDNVVMSQQKGVFRVNCIDCLDRTNVVQSAFARFILNKQLGAVALLNPQGSTIEIDQVFNDVWANNGDAISRAYAGTSALKGDFTRTGKRDLSGLLNDGVNSLARMYSSTFSDWFSQAVIDFMLGNRNISVFSEFLHKLKSSDPRDLLKISKVRAEAIATSVSRLLPEGERLLSGWTLFAPEELNCRVGDKFEEKVLLLSAKALYIVSYDYILEKVKVATQIPLGDIVGISKGAYILSPLEEASRDPLQNAGFTISWNGTNQITRVTSYSIRNSVSEIPDLGGSPSLLPPNSSAIPPTQTSSGINAPSIQSLTRSLGRIRGTSLSAILSKADPKIAPGDKSYAAFKMLPIDPMRVRRGSSTGTNVEYTEAADELSNAANCKEAAEMIVNTIRQACEGVGNAGHNISVIDEDVVSLAEAQRMTSVYAKMEYGVKRLLWLGS